MKEFKFSPSLIISVALVISSVIFGMFYYSAQLKSNNLDSLSVTGSTKARVTSDQAKLIITFSSIANSNELTKGYKEVAKDLELTRKLLKDFSVDPNNIIESPVAMNQIYDNNYSLDMRYQLTQVVSVQLDDVVKITEISKKVPELASQGGMISVQSLEYYYSQLPDLRVSLLSQAIQDAKARAEKIAEGTGRQIGNVQAASSGVVQVMTTNSVDVSDFGSYDTSSIEKDVMVTVKASFRLK